MGKPSIFSSEYERRMKRRKKIRIIVAIIIVIAGLLAIFKGKAADLINGATSNHNKNSSDISGGNLNNNEDKSAESIEENKSSEPGETKSDEKIQEKSMDIKLSNGDIFKAIYEGEGAERKFTFVSGSSNSGSAEANPSGKLVLVTDNTSQDLKLYNTEGSETVITKSEYVTSKGEVFPKQRMLSTYPDFMWCRSARFIDDSHIAYLSQLPYFGTGQLDIYIWIIDLNTGEHKSNLNLKGKEVIFGSSGDGKIQVTVDKQNFMMSADGSVQTQ
ncbi:MAG: hypothetical protein ABRQ25_06500 [Clostridiaceae bacterium]